MTTASIFPISSASGEKSYRAIARDISQEFAQTAVERDRLGGSPTSEIDRLKESGLLSLVVPQVYGGPGATWAAGLKIVQELSKADGSLGQLYGNHLNLTALGHVSGTATQKEQFYRETAQQQLFWSNAINTRDTKWIGEYIQQQHQRSINFLHYSNVAILPSNLKSIMDSIGGCERILRTPLPLAYVIHLKQLVLIYCILLPFQLVKDLGWWTGLFVGLVSFTLLGIEEIGIEIENPFGYDDNDLPLDTICNTVKQDIEELINSNYAIAPSLEENYSEISRI